MGFCTSAVGLHPVQPQDPSTSLLASGAGVPKPWSTGDPGSPMFCWRLRIDGRRPCRGACAEDRPGPHRHPSWVFASDGRRPCRSSLTAYERIDAVTCTYSNNVGIQLVSLAVRPPPSFRRRRLRDGRAETYAKAAACNLQAQSAKPTSLPGLETLGLGVRYVNGSEMFSLPADYAGLRRSRWPCYNSSPLLRPRST